MNITSRNTWGARHGRGEPDPGPEPRVVIHHSYKPALSPRASASVEMAAVRAIERYHVETNGWDGIGYNWLVAPSGRVYEGRGWQYKGAHAGPVNGRSIGICLLIDGNTTDPVDPMIEAVRGLIRIGLEDGELAANYIVSGHRDHMAGRTCPGDRVYKRLQELRHDAAPVPNVAEPPLTATVIPPNLEKIILPSRAHFRAAADVRGLDFGAVMQGVEVVEAILRIMVKSGVRQAKPAADVLAEVLKETS